MRPAPRRSRWVQSPRMRARLYSSWASSTWSLPSAECAWSAKMSRMIAVRSITGTSSAASRLRSWRGSELVVAGDQVGAGALDLGLQLVELAAAEVAVGVGRLARLDHLARGRDAGGAQQLLELGEWIVARPSAPRWHDADRERALARAGVANAGSGSRSGSVGGAVRRHDLSVRRSGRGGATGTGWSRARRRARPRRSRPSARRCRSWRGRARGRPRSSSGSRSRRRDPRPPGSRRTGR